MDSKYLRYLLVVVAALVMAAGCRMRVASRGTVRVAAQMPTPPTATVQVQVGTPMAQAGVSVVQQSCQPGAPESCNGLDDNCDGIIDEGCGYSSGNIQITLAWNSGADLDMYVTDPAGYTISYQNRQSPSGGQLDQDARGACRASQPNNTIENVFWNSPQPPSGQYSVEIHYWGDCGSAGATTAVLSIAVGGQVIGAYTATLNPHERMPVAVFNIP